MKFYFVLDWITIKKRNSIIRQAINLTSEQALLGIWETIDNPISSRPEMLIGRLWARKPGWTEHQLGSKTSYKIILAGPLRKIRNIQ